MGVRLSRSRLDRDLAAGGAGDESALHSLRADQLMSRGVRSRIAAGLRRVVDDAAQPHSVLTAVPFRGSVVLVHLRQSDVLPWTEALQGLADRLDDSLPVDSCGVARAWILLTDVASPLFHSDATRQIDEMIWWIADGLALPTPGALGRVASTP